MARVFIDGSVGTTGLRIHSRLEGRSDIELICLEERFRKDSSARADALNSAEVAFLCLPDDAAREAVSFAENPDTIIIDTSTAHRTDEDWTYGFAELEGQRERIAASKRIANPGCHATGFIALVAPLVSAGIVPADAELSCLSVTGYSGGGKRMIAEYEDEAKSRLLQAPRLYGLSQGHKHLPEMQKLCGLKVRPCFMPVVSDFYSGMEVAVPLFASRINGDADSIRERYRRYYRSGLVRFAEPADEGGFLSASAFSGRDDLQISVHGGKDRILLTARFDNLGKGASGAAIQNMNIALGLDEAIGLIREE